METKNKTSIFNVILSIMLVLIVIMGIFLIVLSKNRDKLEVVGRSGEELKNNYATTEISSNTWDVSANIAGSVMATLSDDGTVTISGTGDMKDWDGSISAPWYSVRDKIKNVIIEEGVTSIGNYAFYRCSSLTRIEIPSSVTSIGNCAFGRCSSLTSIDVNENNTIYIDEDGVLYNKNKTKIIRYPEGKQGTTYTIPSGVTSIGYYAFDGCSSLTSIVIPEGVTSIGASAFDGCSSLTSIEIPSSVTSIGNYAFNGCSSLTSIVIPEGVTSIGVAAFYRCSSLTSIVIPEGVTSIEASAFYGCSSLTSIEIPSSVTSIGDHAFDGCSSLTSIVIPEGITSIGNLTFYECNLTTGIVTGEQEIMPKILERALDENDILYTTKEFTLTNCEMNATGDKIKVNKTPASIKVNDGALVGLTVVVVSSGTITYSTTEPTNKNVNAILHIAEGEKITNNNGSNVYTFERNGEFIFTYETKDGEEKTAVAKVTNIDKVAPTANVTYSLSTNKDQNTVTIKANEQIQSVEGWTLSSDKLTLTKTYKENTGANGEDVVIKDIAGNSTTVNIKVTDIEKRVFTLTQYVIKDKYITKIQPNTKYENFIKDIQTDESYTIKEGDKTVNSTSIMKTGQVLTIGDESYTIIVTGDCNGDGQTELKDILVINKHRLNKATLTAEYLQGADVNGDGKADLKDILQINKFRLGKINEL